MPDSVPPLSLHAWLRFDAISRLLPREARSLLEIGAGEGSVGALLARRLAYVGLEPDTVSFQTAVRRLGSAGTMLNERAETFESPDWFDIVCAFEVIEHMGHERATLASWQRHLRPGGWMLLSVPAGPHRFGPTDVKAGHLRRYSRSGLTTALAHAGLVDVEVVTYGFPLGYALEAGRNFLAPKMSSDASLDSRTASSGRWLQPPEWAAPFMRALSTPFCLVQRPFASTELGTGLVARARKPENV